MPFKDQLDRIEKRQEQMFTLLNGDADSPGLKGRVDRLEQTHGLIKWFAGTTVASLITAVASWFHK